MTKDSSKIIIQIAPCLVPVLRYQAVLAIVLLVTSTTFTQAQQRRTSSTSNPNVTVKAGETLSTVAARAQVSEAELSRVNGLSPDARLRKGQRLVLPTQPANASPPPSGEAIGKRIVFTDGETLDVDDAWTQGDSTWYRINGTSQSVSRTVRSIEVRYKAAPTQTPDVANTPVVTPAARKPEPKEIPIWIYLVDGARLRVDEIREVADGAWYNRGKLTIFLDRERIARIEREEPGVPGGGDLKQHGWSSGNSTIDDMIRKNAGRVGIDPYLVFLVIEQESHFRPRALSPKGAQGLMQLMPGTARRFGVKQPFDVGENIKGGTQYLKELLTMFDGRVDLALASYNAGEGRVLGYGNRVPPFKETRDYVKRISSRYRANKKEEPAREEAAGRPQ
jgi:LysM repeat protein